MLQLVEYTEEWRQPWEEFINQSINGTFLHSRSFYDCNPSNALDDCSLLFLKKRKIVALLPLINYAGERGLTLHSHPRSTYGGFVVSTEIGTSEAVEMVQLTNDFARQKGAAEVIIRNPFRIFSRQLSDETDYAMWFHGFALKSREVEIAIDLQPPIEEIVGKYENGTKYNVKKAEKFVIAGVSDDFDSFWPILEQNLAQKHGKKPVHSLDAIKLLRKNVGEENVLLFAGLHEGKMVCGTVVFRFGSRALHAQYIASDARFQDLRPINAVTNYIIKWGKENGYAYYNLGTANEDGGKVINQGLFHFKEGFGGRGTLRETMSLSL